MNLFSTTFDDTNMGAVLPGQKEQFFDVVKTCYVEKWWAFFLYSIENQRFKEKILKQAPNAIVKSGEIFLGKKLKNIFLLKKTCHSARNAPTIFGNYQIDFNFGFKSLKINDLNHFPTTSRTTTLAI